MPNMSYCRFRNTLSDLRDCYDAMDKDSEEYDDDLSEEEQQARSDLIDLCKDIANEF